MNILEEAGSLVDGPRQEDYGHPSEDFGRTARMWTAILGINVSAVQVGLCMVALKISRHCNKPGRDNLVDGAGYFRTIEMIEDFYRRIEEEMKEAPGKIIRMPAGASPAFRGEGGTLCYRDKNGDIHLVSDLEEKAGE